MNTTHLVAAYDVLLPERLSKNELLAGRRALTLKRPFERLFSSIYNQSDGLVVLSEGLRAYWRERGVTAPIHVIPRAVQPEVFDRPLGEDPYTHLIAARVLPQRGPRLLCAGRHTREKAQDRVIRIFAKHVLPQEPDATLTLVGDGPDTRYYRRVARELGAEHRVFFTGEVPWTTMPDFYRYADVFVHASLSETYGNVLGEALWCGTPTVAFADGMGVSRRSRTGSTASSSRPARARRGASRRRGFRSRGRRAHSRPAGARAPRQGGRQARARAVLTGSPCSSASPTRSSTRRITRSPAGCARWRDRPKVMQWLTTLRHARPWTTYNGLIYLGGPSAARPARLSASAFTPHRRLGIGGPGTRARAPSRARSEPLGERDARLPAELVARAGDVREGCVDVSERYRLSPRRSSAPAAVRRSPRPAVQVDRALPSPRL